MSDAQTRRLPCRQTVPLGPLRAGGTSGTQPQKYSPPRSRSSVGITESDVQVEIILDEAPCVGTVLSEPEDATVRCHGFHVSVVGDPAMMINLDVVALERCPVPGGFVDGRDAACSELI